MTHSKTSSSSARGFSLIEMMVGVLIISFGLLGLITLQARALQTSVTTEDSQRAALLANEMAAQMINANSLSPDNATIVQPWAARASDPASGGLPNGEATISVDNANRVARITVKWTPTGDSTQRYSYSTDVVVP